MGVSHDVIISVYEIVSYDWDYILMGFMFCDGTILMMRLCYGIVSFKWDSEKFGCVLCMWLQSSPKQESQQENQDPRGLWYRLYNRGDHLPKI